MPPSNPPRKFAPMPIEETSKSSRQPATPKEDKPKPRRFAPQPIEETTKSSKDAHTPAEQAEKPKTRRFAPEPIEETTKSSKHGRQTDEQPDKPKVRRFAPEPVEQTVKSSKEPPKQPPKSRRFAPQVVEETHKSSKDKEAPVKKSHVKFTPELVSTIHSSNKKPKPEDEFVDREAEQRPPRKFTPILIDTATRSRRAGNPDAGFSEAHKTEYAYHLHSREHWKRVTGPPSAEGEPNGAGSHELEEEEDAASESEQSSTTDADHSSQAKRQVCALDGSAPKRPSCLIPNRAHSFRMPDLDTIESSESEPDSNPSPLSSSPGPGGSPITASDISYEFYKHATRKRESVDENFTHYLLDIEREKQRKRLEEQALAAFPNPDFGYEHPDHYIHNDDDSDDMEIEDRPVTFDDFEDDAMDIVKPHRDSTATMTWEQQEAQRYAETMQQERNAKKVTAKPSTAKPNQGPFWKAPEVEGQPPDAELKSMRERARPPMLGGDLVFPRCPSPEPARFDVTQGSAHLRNQMCYLNEVAEAERKKSGEDGGLWQARGAENKPIWSIRSPVADKTSTRAAKGLWGGFCQDTGEKKADSGLGLPPGPTGLVTPQNEAVNPFQQMFTAGQTVGIETPQTPTNLKESDLGQLDAALVTERELDAVMEREFPDSFITQVYNYLSLGYPSLARPFDEELSKISRFSMYDLRQDDQIAKATPRGYIRLGPDFEGGGGEGMSEDSCMRWQALKRYVREWARQEKNMVKTDDLNNNWGTGARRGSWAI